MGEPTLEYMAGDIINGNTLIIFLGFGAYAKDISGLSLYPAEAECLISPVQRTDYDEKMDINLTKVTTGEYYAKIDGIKFVTSPDYFTQTCTSCEGKRKKGIDFCLDPDEALANGIRCLKC